MSGGAPRKHFEIVSVVVNGLVAVAQLASLAIIGHWLSAPVLGSYVAATAALTIAANVTGSPLFDLTVVASSRSGGPYHVDRRTVTMLQVGSVVAGVVAATVVVQLGLVPGGEAWVVALAPTVVNWQRREVARLVDPRSSRSFETARAAPILCFLAATVTGWALDWAIHPLRLFVAATFASAVVLWTRRPIAAAPSGELPTTLSHAIARQSAMSNTLQAALFRVDVVVVAAIAGAAAGAVYGVALAIAQGVIMLLATAPVWELQRAAGGPQATASSLPLIVVVAAVVIAELVAAVTLSAILGDPYTALPAVVAALLPGAAVWSWFRVAAARRLAAARSGADNIAIAAGVVVMIALDVALLPHVGFVWAGLVSSVAYGVVPLVSAHLRRGAMCTT